MKRVEIRDFGEAKGKGIIALDKINKGEYVVSYLGEVIGHVESKRREKLYEAQKLQHYYMYETKVQKVLDRSTRKRERLVIDPTIARPEYGWARLMNCGSPAQVNLRPRQVKLKEPPYVEIQFFAKRDIEPGEELLFDYDPATPNKGFCVLPAGASQKSNKER